MIETLKQLKQKIRRLRSRVRARKPISLPMYEEDLALLPIRVDRRGRK